jgi:hypothetical protein
MPEFTSFSMFGNNSSTLLALIGGISSCLFLCYRWALPRPIPGIPYNKEATKTLLGDIIPFAQYIGRTKEVASWWTIQTIQLQSPIIQLFCRVFGKPFVMISDFREAQGTCFLHFIYFFVTSRVTCFWDILTSPSSLTALTDTSTARYPASTHQRV